MDWLDTVIKKLPTLKGVTAFFYVATHWSTISHDFEEYRRQIKDREDWLKTQGDTLKKLHRLEMAKLTKEFEGALKGWRDIAIELGEKYTDAVVRLTMAYYSNPLQWQLDREQLSPQLHQTIEAMLATLPPAPPPQTFNDIV